VVPDASLHSIQRQAAAVNADAKPRPEIPLERGKPHHDRLSIFQSFERDLADAPHGEGR
jgi:hypothetical protein